jgi:UDP-3-O-[3-hydroxymyristoyl] glucosamine N-acyltransferase
MVDPRFYCSLGPVSAGDLAASAGLALAEGQDGSRLVSGCAALEDAQANDVSFCQKPSDTGQIETGAGIVILAADHVSRLPPGPVALLSTNPRADFAKVARALVQVRLIASGDRAIDPQARLEDGVQLMPHVVIGADAAIGAGTRIGPGAVIGPGVQIGRGCVIGAGAVIQCALIGDRVTIGANSVIGEAGFGVAPGRDGPVDVPQLGRVIIQDDVTIGALVAVDRGAFGDTIIGLATKIDNLCQIAHNVRLGRGVVMAAYCGVSGSTVIGDFAMLGGRVGVADHLTVGTRAMLAAGSGVLHNVPDGETWGGYPAKPRRDWVRELANLKRLGQSASKTRPA